jgi:hypothetical protein
MPGSQIELFDEAGHFPHLDDPVGFAWTLKAFLEETEPARIEAGMMRELVLDRNPKSAARAQASPARASDRL